MPALITHYLHAKKVYENVSRPGVPPLCKLPSGDSPLQSDDSLLPSFDESLEKSAFLLGAQGPDFLFFHRVIPIIQFGKSLRKVGVKMHRIPAEKLFSAFAQYCIEHKDSQNIRLAAAYSSGFLCHYMLDSAAHPFIFAMQNDMIRKLDITYFDGCVHSKIEHSIDVIMLNKLCNEQGNTFDYSCALSGDKRILSECSAMISFALERLIGKEIKPKRILRGFKDYRNLAKFTRDKYGKKHNFFRFIERTFHLPPSLSTFIRQRCADGEFDYANFSHRLWRNPYDGNSDALNYDFLQIFDKSVNDTAIKVRQFLSTIKQGSADMSFIGRKSYKTGLEISENADFDDTY